MYIILPTPQKSGVFRQFCPRLGGSETMRLQKGSRIHVQRPYPRRPIAMTAGTGLAAAFLAFNAKSPRAQIVAGKLVQVALVGAGAIAALLGVVHA